jgi:hypothetical protein
VNMPISYSVTPLTKLKNQSTIWWTKNEIYIHSGQVPKKNILIEDLFLFFFNFYNSGKMADDITIQK